MSVQSSAAAAAAAETALRRKLYSDNVNDEEDVPDSKEGVFRTVLRLLERTILQSEGNSLLIVGPRGSGKTWIINRVFRSLQNNRQCKGNYIKVYLNGLVHTNDRMALLDIAQQLDINTDVTEQASMTFSAALEYLLSTLRSGSHSNQSIVFVLDEFDQFAHHKNQSLLYNLLDISQSPHNPIAVIGLTCRLDVVELLEKRVKSRFSHRQLLLFPLTEFSDYVSLARSLLTLPRDFSHHKYQEQWNQHLKDLLEDTVVLQTLRTQFRISSDVQSLKNLLLLPVSKLGPNNAHLSPSDFSLSLELIHGDALLAILKGLSVLELSLLVAVRRISELNNGALVNFEMVYSEYKKFAQRAQSVEVFSHSVALKAFDNLLSLELLVPVADSVALSATTSGGQRLKTFTQVNLVINPDLISRALSSQNCPTALVRWASSQPTVT